jgi:hypothetical protein
MDSGPAPKGAHPGMTKARYSFMRGHENRLMNHGTVCRPGGSPLEENMIARCQKRRRTRIAKGGQVFDEQAIWGNLNCLLVFCFATNSAVIPA